MIRQSLLSAGPAHMSRMNENYRKKDIVRQIFGDLPGNVLFLFYQCKSQTVSQNTPGFAKKNDPGKASGTHSGQSGQITEKVIRKEGQKHG